MKNLLLILALLTSFAKADVPATHGMLIFGNDAIYLSHLPMFHSPHDYQGIFQAKLPFSVKQNFLDDKAITGEKIYTLVPERFDLAAMAASPHPFKATLFRGHFERGGQPIEEGFTMSIEKVIHFRKLDPDAEHPAKFNAIIFGDETGKFLAHFITGRPDFDQIVWLKNALALKTGTFPLKNPNHTPLKNGEVIQTDTQTLDVKSSLYVEHGDLE